MLAVRGRRLFAFPLVDGSSPRGTGTTSMHRTVIALALAVAAQACAGETHFYLVDEIAQKAGKPAMRAEARELERIYGDLERASGVEAKLVWSTDPDINAFATEVGGDQVVVVQEGLLAAMDGDRDAVAATLGHELGHHKADHIRAGRRKQEGARVLGGILGAVVGAKVGKGSGAVVGAAAGSVGGSLVALKFSRDQEMEADRLSVGWMIAAGYNPDGMLRLQRRLGALEGHGKAAIFSTHPPSEKRYKAAEQLIAKLAPPPELMARAAEPLVSAQALAAVENEIRHARDERIAEALAPEGGPVTSEALAPAGKLGFDAWAALEGELLYAGAKGRAKLLAKNHLSEAGFSELESTYMVRMAHVPALAARYNAQFYRDAHGPFAAHARDLAESYDKNQLLQLDPPLALDDFVALSAEVGREGPVDYDAALQAAAETRALKPRGLSYYDYVVAQKWWSRKALIDALGGDDATLRRLVSAGGDDDDDQTARAEAAGVHIGRNVRVGHGVRVGASAASKADDGD